MDLASPPLPCGTKIPSFFSAVSPSVTLASAIVYLAVYVSSRSDLETGETISTIASNFGLSIKFALQQLIRPFSVWSRYGEAELAELGSPLAMIVQIVAGIQAVVSYTLLALFGLAVRWRFRRG